MSREPDIVERLRNPSGDIFPMCKQAADEIERLEAEVERLRALVKDAGDAIEKLAFEMPPPNEYTPRLVLMAQTMRAALEPKP